ncbi:O-antigen polymerase [Providencia sp. PROV201]|uniref:O-antigen polymerase n=1 Tax=Providencia sp. PROV201 TaxID=2949901 RepID=UPI00234B72AC|nr:O-antigen polymerase [Providencia sp. PROV201]
MISTIYLILAITFYFLIYVKSKDKLHPLGIGVLLWFLACSLSSYDDFFDSNLQVHLSTETHICMLLAGFFYSIPFIFSKKKNKEVFITQRIYFSSTYILVFNLLLCLTIIAFFIRFRTEISSPALFTKEVMSDLKSTIPDALPGLHYIELLTPYLAILAYLEMRLSLHIRRKRYILLVAYIFYSIITAILYKVSRGELLIFVLGYLYIFFSCSLKQKNFNKIIILSIFIAIFIFVGITRISDESRVSTQFGSGTLNTIFSQFYTYIAMNFQNLNSIVSSTIEPTYIWGSLKFFLRPFFSNEYDMNELGLLDDSVLFFNAKTFLYYFYNDLGIAGVILYPLIIGLILQVFYNAYCKDIKYLAMLAPLMKAIVFMFFGNYFFGELVLLTPYFVVFLFISMMQTKNESTSKNTN